MEVDVIIFGGGSVGLWLVDELNRLGFSCLLLERYELGSGQTISSQGIIHGGLKYTLAGQLTGSAQQIREMPGRWLASMQGEQQPDLSAVSVRSPYCYLWRTESVSSQLGMIGARIGLRVAPEKISAGNVPGFMDPQAAQIYKLPETVISPRSFIEVLAERNQPSLLKLSDTTAVEFLHNQAQKLWGLRLQEAGQELLLRSSIFVLTAGRGNDALREAAGLAGKSMQRRPLHMLMLKGNLPDFCGHCVDGAKTRVTITSERISPTECIWQIGGNIAEIGVKLSDRELIEFGYRELQEVLPRMNWEGVQAATYHIDRAEGKTALGNRPEQPVLMKEGNVITCWPTKLALVPVAVEQIRQHINSLVHQKVVANPQEQAAINKWAKPGIAKNPWEVVTHWVPLAGTGWSQEHQQAAA